MPFASSSDEESKRPQLLQVLPLMDVIGPLVDHQASASLKQKAAEEVAAISSAPTATGGRGMKRKPWAQASGTAGSRQKSSGSEVRLSVLILLVFAI
jgi:hypothetical protein